MRSTLLVTVVLVVWVGQGRTNDEKTTAASTDPKKEDKHVVFFRKVFNSRLAPPPPIKVDDKDDSSDEVVEDPNALEDESCDELWALTKKEDVKVFTDEIVEWTNLCAMKHGLCPMSEYWSSSLLHGKIEFYYNHDVLSIKTRVSTSLEERCSNPSVDWEKVGQKYQVKDSLRDMKRIYRPYIARGKRRRRKNSKAANQ